MPTNGLLFQEPIFWHLIIKIRRNLMATVVRLTRMGRTKKPFYRIVVTDSRKKRDGGWIESIGYYNPMVEPRQSNLMPRD